MRIWISASMIAFVAATGICGAISASGQTAAYRAPRTPDGKPDLNGIWQALNTADWELEGHAATKGPVASLGAVFSVQCPDRILNKPQPLPTRLIPGA